MSGSRLGGDIELGIVSIAVALNMTFPGTFSRGRI